jgi:acetyl esterase/lipase
MPDASAAVPDAPSCVPFEGSAPPPASVPVCRAGLPTAPTGERTEVRDSGVVVHHNQVLATRGGVVLEGDLWLPAATATGILVIVHGGGWLDCENRRDTMSPYAELVARTQGIAALNVEYRLAQEGGGYPENVSDVVCAVQWAHAHAADFGLEDRVGIAGVSAGGHLALMASLIGSRTDVDPGCGSDASLDVVLSWAGPSDLPSFVASSSEARQAPLLYTGEDCSTPLDGCVGAGRACTRCVDASPSAHACSASAAPFLLVQAPDPYDRLVPEAQARGLASALGSAGANVTLVVPTDAEMRANGCTPEGGSHALDGCTLAIAGPIVDPIVRAAIGPR